MGGLTTLSIPVGLACIMLTVGLGLAVRDFAALVERRRAVALGLVLQTVVLPLLAVVVGRAFRLEAPTALGLVLIACVPGGVTSNFVTVLARGDAALSVVLTALTTLIGAFTVPVVLALAAAWLAPGSAALPNGVPLAGTAATILLVTVLPLSVGMAARALLAATVLAGLATARRLATVVFVAIVTVAVHRDWAAIEAGWQIVGPAVLAFNVAAVLAGLGLARAARLGDRLAVTLAIEGGLQNIALALVLGGSVLGVPETLVPAAIYVLVMNASALVLIAYGRRLTAPASPALPRA